MSEEEREPGSAVDDDREEPEGRPHGPEADAGASSPGGGEAPDDDAGSDEPEAGGGRELPEEIRDQLQELEELRDKHLRLAAEFDNYRKRTRRELSGQREQAQAELAGELLEVLDDFTRITESAREGTSAEALLEGVEMVERKLRKVLEDAGLRAVEAEGERFDPRAHEALTTTPVDDPDEDGVVSQVLVRGYRFGDRLLRPARVEVQKYRSGAADEEGGAGEDGETEGS